MTDIHISIILIPWSNDSAALGLRLKQYRQTAACVLKNTFFKRNLNFADILRFNNFKKK